VVLYLVKTIANPCFVYGSRLLRSFSDVSLKSELKANRLPSEKRTIVKAVLILVE